MKVKAKGNYDFGITKDKIYNTVGISCSGYNVFNDGGIPVFLKKNLCEPVPDTPQIEVGSEWVDVWRHTCTVLGVGEEEVFIKNHTMNLEHTYKKDKFLADLKPKPKTVTMYFYKDKEGRISATDYDIKYSDYICKKEIEL